MARCRCIVEKLNKILEDNGQELRIIFYLYNPKKIILSNQDEYEGNHAIRIIRRLISDNKCWAMYFDDIYLRKNEEIVSFIKALYCREGGINCQKMHGESIKLNLIKREYKHPKGWAPKGGFWQTGKTKHTDERLARSSENRKGKNNPNYGKLMSDEDKKIKSDLMKKKIEEGEFTPNSNNRNTHYDSFFNNKKFRSSWEAVYFAKNQEDLYESLRIPYEYEGRSHIYIVDFVNHEKRIATEVKPKEMLTESKTVAKLSALRKWCGERGYELQVITQDEIAAIINDGIDLTLFDTETQRKMKYYETYQKSRDRKA